MNEQVRLVHRGPRSWGGETTVQLHSDEINANESFGVLRVALLGGFRVERAGASIADPAWRRRSAKRLTKLLATHPSHSLHREQIFDILWPEADVDSARNSLAKALHAARHALEPERRPREHSSCLRSKDDMVVLDCDQVLIDTDAFQRLAQSALKLGAAPAYEAALAAYTGPLLPEDLYEDWASERRQYLADLNIRLLLGLAEVLEHEGAHRVAVDRLRTALQEEPLREDVHRRLMRLYGAIGERGLALRQFEYCRELLRRELGVVPEQETIRLHDDLVANRVERRRSFTEAGSEHGNADADPARTKRGSGRASERATALPFVGREPMLRELREQLARADAGDGGVVVVSGEAGVGKTRLVAKFARDAQRRGACVLGDPAHTSSFPYGPFAAAVEGYVAARPEHERAALARRYPTLGCLVPSVQIPALSLVTDDGSEATYVRLGTEIARLLTDVAEDQTVVLVLGDLDEAHPSSLGLLQYLANLARQRRWLVIATLRDEAMVPGSGALRMLTLMTYERLCVHVRLPRLGREESDRLARAQLQGRTLDGGFLERMYSRTDGNPLFIEELAREVAERVPDVDIALGADHIPNESFRVPPTVRAVVEKAITPLGSSVRRVLELAAVAGPQVPLEDLRTAAAELEPPLGNVELFDALDRLLSTRMMLEDQDAYAIRHALVREVLLQDLPQHRRAQLTAALGKTARKRRTRLDTGTRPISWPRVREPEPELH